MTLEQITAKYPEAATLVGMAKTAWEGNKTSARVDFLVSDRLKTKLVDLLGKEIKTMFITDSDVRHIKKEHGSGEARRGQIDVTPEDLALIPVILNEFDIAVQDEKDRLGNRKMLFMKTIETNLYVAAVERGNNQIGTISFWKMARQGAPMSQ
ncbi:MAG: hypothetical protein LBM77_03530 [Spirochaetaceae bacterium]|jgi:hypothetical protein|nr:hypothetical protein [Spirochaetaceae bacterium]